MGNVTDLALTIQTILNNNCIDPFPSNLTRKGNHFFTESDGLNFTRRDTFPKGEIYIPNGNGEVVTSPIGNSGYANYTAVIYIFYYAKDQDKYEHNGITYRNKYLLYFMLSDIRNVLLNNHIQGQNDYFLIQNAFGEGGGASKMENSSFVLWSEVLPVTFYWVDTYGN